RARFARHLPLLPYTTLFRSQVASTKIGESLGATEKKQECVVSGGVGTMAVSYKGETFYVCCSGCRDEFNANPEKYIKEFKAKKRSEEHTSELQSRGHLVCRL